MVAGADHTVVVAAVVGHMETVADRPVRTVGVADVLPGVQEEVDILVEEPGNTATEMVLAGRPGMENLAEEPATVQA